MALNKVAGLITTPRWLVAALSIVLASLLAGGIWFYQSQNEKLSTDAENTLRSIAEMKAGQISDWRAERLADAGLFTESPYLIESISAFLKNPGPQETEKLLKRFRSSIKHENYREIILVDQHGRILLSTGGSKGALHPLTVKAVADSLRGMNVAVTDLHRGPGDQSIHIDSVAPIRLPEGENSGRGVAIVLRVDADDFLYPLVQSWPVPSKTAETLLVEKDGDSVLFLNELRHQKGAALKLRIPLGRTDVPAVMAVLGHEGVKQGKDYRGVEVLSAIRPIPGSPWYIVAKVDSDEALAYWKTRSITIVGFVLALMLAAVGMAGMTWQRGMKAQYRERVRADAFRLEAEKRYGVTLMSIGDGVVVTDREGRVTILNPVAEQLTGWKLADAIGKPLVEVFKIINEESRKSVENPVVRVFSEGSIVGLANHTLLIANDGREIPIMDSGAPIRDEAGEIVGAVLVFRDQSADRAAQSVLQASEELYHSLFNNMLNGFAFCRMIYDEQGRPDDFVYLEVNEAFKKQTGLEDVVGKRVSEVIPGIREADRGLLERYGNVARTGKADWFETYVNALKMWFHVSVYSPRRDHFVAVFDVITERKRAEQELRESEEKFRNVFEASNVGKSLTLSTGEVVPNRAFCEMLGYTYEELSKKTWQEITPPEDIDATGKMLEPLLKGESDAIRFSKRYVRKNGSIIWADVSTAIRRGKDGKPLHFITTIVDITERKLAEKAVADALETNRAIFENSPVGILIYKSTGQCVTANEAAAKMVGATVDVLKRQNFRLVESWKKSGLYETAEEALSVGRSVRKQLEVTTTFGVHLWITVIFTPFQSGGELHLMTMFDDYSERKKAEDALSANENQYRALVDSSQEMIVLHELVEDASGKAVDYRILDCNPAFSKITGIPKEKAVSALASELYGTGSAPYLESYAPVATTGVPARFETYFSGMKKYFRISAYSPSRGRFATISSDVTDRRLAEEELKESEENFRAIFENNSAAIAIIEADTTISMVNDAYCSMGGYSRDEVVGTSWTKQIPPDDLIRLKEYNKRRLENPKDAPEKYEFKFFHRSGQVRHAQMSVSFIPTRRKIVAAFIDITERKLAELAMKEGEERFRRIFDLSPVGIVLVSPEFRFLRCNESFCGFLGYPESELLGKTFLDVTHPEDLQIGRIEIKAILEGKLDFTRIQKRYLTKTGKAVWGDVTIRQLRGLGGQTSILIAIIQDITERQMIQEQLLQSQKMESVGRLAGGVAHDFNNLLTGIMGNISLTLDELGESDPLRGPLEDLGKAAESAAALTRQLLAFSRKQIVEPRVLNVNEIILQSQKMLHRLLGEDVDLKAHLAGDLGNVKADPAQIEQIIVNLAVNARDAMPDGGVLTLETANTPLGEDYCSRHPGTDPGNYVMIAVSDTGTGMTPDVKSHLFEPFFTTKEKGKGTGLGLSTVFGAVKQNGGNIDVYSEVGQGTMFKIYLPRVYETSERASRPANDEMLPGSETIILVEDEDIVRGYAEKVLKKAGYKVHAFSNGGEAIAFAGQAKEQVHMLVTDVIMPGINGRVLAKNLRELIPGLKVLFSSGYTENVIAHHGVLDKGIAFIGKPYTPQAFARKVREVLDEG